MMAEDKTKFWLGLTLGALGGLLAARKRVQQTHMPNSRIWTRILREKMGLVEAAAIITKVEQRYRDLMKRRPVFDHLVFDFHVKGNILPGLALYEIFREEGLSHEETIDEINRIFKIWFYQFPPLNLVVSRFVHYLPENFTFFQRLVLLATDWLFPNPGWQYEIVERTRDRFSFNMTQCFYLDVLTYYETIELTPVFCRLDDILMEVMPNSIKWGRTKTIAQGGDCCDFCWDFVPVESLDGGGDRSFLFISSKTL